VIHEYGILLHKCNIIKNPACAGFFIARPELLRNENLVNIGT